VPDLRGTNRGSTRSAERSKEPSETGENREEKRNREPASRGRETLPGAWNVSEKNGSCGALMARPERNPVSGHVDRKGRAPVRETAAENLPALGRERNRAQLGEHR
jgi:hypothetical protein